MAEQEAVSYWYAKTVEYLSITANLAVISPILTETISGLPGIVQFGIQFGVAVALSKAEALLVSKTERSAVAL
ncbi:hypothetical protein Tdes44962_MAKER09729 [Teratosphaeria destructans]|uniref:Uncharacterized protein n=1 Tax=Teratosphaeria destructans TaxID=418781 RepID=A0A9W7SRE0_9PEZI|nr:hypothetical protein Tdes44962_MAKER09729 [Teratosphaeria destructans]